MRSVFRSLVLVVAMIHQTQALIPPTTATAKRNINKQSQQFIIGHQRQALLKVVSNQWPSVQDNKLFVRGGTKSSEDTSIPEKPPTSKVKKILLPILVSSLVVTAALNRKAIAAFNFKEELANALDILSSKGTPGLVIYTFFFMLWEITVGVTTPVETAAAMAFGLKKGLLVNVIGKTSGALMAFLLGRFILKDYMEKKFEGNEYMDLVRDSIRQTPVRVALIWRFSFLPEQVKNFGLAILPIKIWQFVSAVLMHGFPFSLLWSFMGNEMGLVVRGALDSPSRALKICLGGVYVFGFFISPTMVGLWLKGLRAEKKKKDAESK